MGKKGGWFSLNVVRKAFNSNNNNDDNPKENKDKNEKKPQKTVPKKSWFGKQKSIESESSHSGSVADAPENSSPPPEQEVDVKSAEQQAETSERTEPENEPSKLMVPEQEVESNIPVKPEKEMSKPAKPENEASKLVKPEIEYKRPTKPENEPTRPGYTRRAAAAFRRILGRSKEEMAAVKVQTAFRRFLARKKLRSLKGLVRLKVLVQSQSVKRQAVTTLRCMQTLARVQSQVRTRRIRMSEDNQALQRQLMQKRERELDNMKYMGTEWDNTRRSKEQIVATMQHKENAAARRERALAYAQTQQQMWRNQSKSANPTFMDPNNPQWGWSWLDRWMAARPWESQTDGPSENDQSPAKLIRSSSFGDTSQKLDRSPSMASPRSPSVSNRRLTISSPKSINDFTPSPRNRRHSISNSSIGEGSTSRGSSPRVASPRVASPRSTKTKSLVPSPSKGQSPIRSPSPSPLGSVKKGTVEKKTSNATTNRRMSLSGTPSTGRGRGADAGRRLSMSARVGSGTR